MNHLGERQGSVGRALFRRLLHSYFLVTRGLTIGVRAVVRSADGKFLLVRHTYTPGWHFPGGGVERGQTTESALRRELLQETDLELVGRPVLHGVFYNDKVSRRDHVLAYLCEVRGNLAGKPASVEIAEIGYFDLQDLPPDTDPGTVRRMREIVEGLGQSACW